MWKDDHSSLPSKAITRMFLEQNNLCNWFHSAIASNYLLTSQEIQIFPPWVTTQSLGLCNFRLLTEYLMYICMRTICWFYLLIFMVSFFLKKIFFSKCRVSFSFCLRFHRLFMKQRNKVSVWLVKWNLFTKVKFQVLWFSAIDICQVGKFFWLPSSFIEQKHIFFLFWFVNCTVFNCFP